ncbi:MAG: extracellular solute-binding protein [Thermomicrobiales bacterium]
MATFLPDPGSGHETTRLRRRTLLNGLSLAGGAAALSALVAACGGAATATTAPAATTASKTTAASTSAAGGAASTTASSTAASSSAASTSKASTTSAASSAASSGSATSSAASSSASAAGSPPAASGGPVKISFYSGGDVNVQDLWQNSLLPAYKKVAPNVSFDFVFSEHGTGDQGTFDRIAAAKQAGKPSGIDIWETGSLLSQGGAAGLIEKVTASNISNLSKCPQNMIDQINGYGVPYRGSSVILGYNSKMVSDPPKTLDALLAWIKKNPGQFTYCPPDTGGSGGAFVTRVLETGIADADLKFFQTDYDQAKESQWDKGWATLKDLNGSIYNNGFYPKGNVPVLQTMGKGSISVAPLWSDQALSYLQQNLLPPEVKLLQIDPPFYGGASWVGVLNDSQNKAAAYAFLNWLLTPDAQNVVIQKLNGYPGIDWKYMPDDVQKKYADIAKSYSIGFSSKFGNDLNKLWYEKVAGTPAPSKP